MSFPSVASALTALLLLASCVASPGPAAMVTGAVVEVAPPYFVGEGNAQSLDISAVACMSARNGARTCFFVDDETKVIQPGLFAEDTIIPGAPIAMIGDAPPDNAFGAAPSGTRCPNGQASFRDLDGEAIALSGDHLYVVGSHGCGRNSGRLRTSSLLLVRAAIDASGALGAPQHSYRLAEAFAADPVLAPFFSRAIAENGLNVEGMTIDGGTLIFGLRAPVIDGEALIVSAPASALFGGGAPPLTLRRLRLGPNTGVRELTTLHDGGLLVLAGPAQDQAGDFTLVTFDQSGQERARATLPTVLAADGSAAKAEGLAVLEVTPHQLFVLVVYDGLANGGPRTFRIPR